MQKQYHKLGEQITLSDKTELTVEIRKKGCQKCHYFERTDCGDIACNFNERPDKENIIYRRNE